jgi:hypothetical protein
MVLETPSGNEFLDFVHGTILAVSTINQQSTHNTWSKEKKQKLVGIN